MSQVIKRKESVKVNMKDLERLELINQVDQCFLLAKLDRLIVALDQHAMHERINLEILERIYKGEITQEEV